MDNLWILTEERPKPSVIKTILKTYCEDFNERLDDSNEEISIDPCIRGGAFSFLYEVVGVRVSGSDRIFIKTVSGSSSFLDFLLFKQEEEPNEKSDGNNLLMAIEETKTRDNESRNTGVYQRGSKFVYIESYHRSVALYMLYNEELEARKMKKPSGTNIFGTNMLLTLGVKVIGKDVNRWFKPFSSRFQAEVNLYHLRLGCEGHLKEMYQLILLNI